MKVEKVEDTWRTCKAHYSRLLVIIQNQCKIIASFIRLTVCSLKEPGHLSSSPFQISVASTQKTLGLCHNTVVEKKQNKKHCFFFNAV